MIATVRTAFLAVVVSGILAAFVQAQDRTLEISRSSYAAIAYSPATGQYGYSYDYRSRKAAEKAALEKCGADDARIACWVNFGFCALALGNDKSCWGVGWKYGNGANNRKADNDAIEDCKTQTTGVHTAVILSSDGQYIWDYKDHVTIIDKDGNVYRGGELIRPPGDITPPPKKPASLPNDGSTSSKTADGQSKE
jgi:serine/threonine-protein kinase